MIDVGFISTLGRMRDTDARQVAALAESIKEVGLLNPITVYPCEIIRNGQKVPGYGLVAGAHRLEAVKSLGWREVPAVVVDLDEQHRIIAECDENLCGTTLNPADRARFTARRKEAYEALHPETRAHVAGAHGSNKSQGNASANLAPAFTADTAAKTGQSERVVQRDAERGAKVCPQALHLIAGTHLDTGKYLDSIKNLPPQEQIARVRSDLKNGQRPKAPRIAEEPESDEAAIERQVAALMAAWNKAGPEARRVFVDRVGSYEAQA